MAFTSTEHVSTAWRAIRSAASSSKPVPALARPGSWCRASCVPCSKAWRPSRSWPSPSRARRPARCATGSTSGCMSSPLRARRTSSASWRCSCVASTPVQQQRSRRAWPRFTLSCSRAAVRCRCTPSTAGLRSWCRGRRRACSRDWDCRSAWSSSKTWRRCCLRSSGAFTSPCCATRTCAPTTPGSSPCIGAARCSTGSSAPSRLKPKCAVPTRPARCKMR